MKKYIPLICSLTFAIGVNLYFRILPINFPQLEARAKQMVEEGVSRAVTQEINKKFPQYDPLAKNRLIKTGIAEYKRQNAAAMKNQIQQLYLKLKDRFQNEDGQTYLMELDCWHWARNTENVVTHGFPGDKIEDGKQIDLLMLAPDGNPLLWDNFLFYISAYLYELFSIFKFVPLFTFLFYLPLFFVVLLVVALYGFSYHYGKHLGAMLCCLFVGLSPVFLPRSCVGWYDKDVLNLLLPVLMTWSYLMAYNKSSSKPKVFWLFLSAFWAGMFCFTWSGWWFAFMVMVIYEVLSLFVNGLLYYWKKQEENIKSFKEHLSCLILFMGFSIIWIMVFAGLQPLIFMYNQIMASTVLSKALIASIWPNVFATVGELKKLGFAEVANSTGGIVVFVCSLICMVYLIARSFWDKAYHGFKRTSMIIFTIWFGAMLFACFQGVRFAMFLSLPLGISLGWAANDMFEYFKLKRRLVEGFVISSIAFIILSGVMMHRISPVSQSLFPLVNDTWYKVLMAMRNGTEKDAVINSWWDFGDWFKVIGRRKVIFDGQSQNEPRAYWMGRAILSTNERQAVAILRMLNNGGNKAYEIIEENLNDQLRSILLLESAMLLEPDAAREILAEYLPSSALEEVMHILFDEPGPAYFVVDASMQSKMGAISFLGSWNFSKVYIAQNMGKMEKDRILDHLVKLGKNNEEVRLLYQEAFLIDPKQLDNWLSKPVQFYSALMNAKVDGDNVFFENGFIYNIKTKSAHTNSGQIPRSLFIIENGTIAEYAYSNANAPFSILVIKDKNGIYSGVLLARSLGPSLFSRLYFLRGEGLQYFTSHIEAQEAKDYIGVYKIEWSGKPKKGEEDEH